MGSSREMYMDQIQEGIILQPSGVAHSPCRLERAWVLATRQHTEVLMDSVSYLAQACSMGIASVEGPMQGPQPAGFFVTSC